MSRYHFRLAALLRYRESLRDQCRQTLARWLSRDAALAEEQDTIEEERRQQHDEMRLALQTGGDLLVDRLAGRRYRLSQLATMQQALDKQRQEVARQVDLCRHALVRADQGVKALERLSDLQRAEFLQREELIESREREEIWQAGHGREV
jgi:flagellar biosynthesis chaperone FliJ